MPARSTARRAAASAVNRALRPLQLRVVRDEPFDDTTLRQLVDAYEQVILPDLAPCAGRFELLKNLAGTQVPEAMHLLRHLQLARASGPGDVCEMGVAQGFTSALIANEILGDERDLWLYDSFEGLSAPTSEDRLIDDIFELGSMDRYAGTMAYAQEHVRARVYATGFPPRRVNVVAGYIRPDLAPEQLPSTVAFAYLDFDLYEPILVGLELMHPRTRAGSVLMVDDYRFFSTGPEQAVQEFLAAHPGSYELFEAPPAAGHFCVLTRQAD